MQTYEISSSERDMIEALYFEKNAKAELFMLLASRNSDEINPEIFQRVYAESVQANVAFNICFDAIVSKYIPKNIDGRNARVEFATCLLSVGEE